MYDYRHAIGPRQIATATLLVLAAAFSTWLVQITAPPPETVQPPPRHDPDYFAARFTTAIMDITGQPHHRLRGEYLEHFPDDDSSEVRRPYFTFFREGAPSWFIESERGRVSSAGEMVWLFGQVYVRRPPGLDPWEMDTFDMRLRPKEQYGETDRAVEIRRPGLVVDAVGMHAYLKEDRVEFLSNVRGRYESPSP
jgi:lipopolysaccharide export system protein LptC